MGAQQKMLFLFVTLARLTNAFVYPVTGLRAIATPPLALVGDLEVKAPRPDSFDEPSSNFAATKATALEHETQFRRTRFFGLVGGVSFLTAAYSVGATMSSTMISRILPFLPAAVGLSVAGFRAIPVRVATPPLVLGYDLEVRSALGPLAEDKGLGLFALRPLSKGTYLFDYEGEVLSESQLHDRYDQGSSTVLVVTDYVAKLTGPWGVEEPIFVDARDSALSNVARFMNHAPKDSPKCNVERRRQRWSFRSHTATKGRAIRFFLSKDVEAGEELSWDYGDRFWIGREDAILM